MYQMYAFEHSSPDQVGTMQALTSMRSNISLYKSTFDFFHIYVFLKPEQTGADEGIYFFSTDKLFNYGISESELHSIGSSSLWLLKKNTTLPRVISASKRSANTLLCFRALQDKSSNVLEYAIVLHLTAMNFPGIFRLLLLIPQFPVTFWHHRDKLQLTVILPVIRPGFQIQ